MVLCSIIDHVEHCYCIYNINIWRKLAQLLDVDKNPKLQPSCNNSRKLMMSCYWNRNDLMPHGFVWCRWIINIYVQDDWKVTPYFKIILNLFLKYYFYKKWKREEKIRGNYFSIPLYISRRTQRCSGKCEELLFNHTEIVHSCCIVARTTWLPVLRNYKDVVFLKHGRQRQKSSERRSVSRRLTLDVTPTVRD